MICVARQVRLDISKFDAYVIERYNIPGDTELPSESCQTNTTSRKEEKFKRDQISITSSKSRNNLPHPQHN